MVLVLLALWIVCAVVTVHIASNKGRSGCLWFFLSVLFGPVALLVVAAIGEERSTRR
jgi:uncharacterized membrane protein YhdT